MLPEIQKHLKSLGRVYLRLLEVKGNRELFLVGGAIRDIILQRQPADFDFAVTGSGIEFAMEFARWIRGKFVLLSEKDDEARVVYRKKFTFDFNGLGERTFIPTLPAGTSLWTPSLGNFLKEKRSLTLLAA